MKNIKLVIALLATVLFSSASTAGELTVSGAAKASLAIYGSNNAAAKQEAGKTLAIENLLIFGASGELDNGATWNYSMQIDKGAVDDPSITIANSWGTLGVFQAAGGLNAKHFGSANVIAYGSQFGRGNTTGEFYDPQDISGISNIQYHTPAGLIPFGTVIKVAKGFAGTATNVPGDALAEAATTGDAMSYSIDVAPLEGLALQGSYTKEETTSARADKGQPKESVAAGAKYAMGNFTIGYTRGVYMPAVAVDVSNASSINYYDNTSYSIGMKVNDNLSISYGREDSEANKVTDGTNVTAEIDTIQAAYTMGGLTLSASVKNVDNYSYVATNDTTEATLFLTLAF